MKCKERNKSGDRWGFVIFFFKINPELQRMNGESILNKRSADDEHLKKICITQ